MRKEMFITIVLSMFIIGCTNNLPVFTGPAVSLNIEKAPSGIIYNNEPFEVKVSVNNALSREINGELCIDDGIPDSFGAIVRGGASCALITLDAAQTDADTYEAVSKTIRFPSTGGDYRYEGVRNEVPFSGNIAATLKFYVESTAEADVCVSMEDNIGCRDDETISSIAQEKLPIRVGKIEKRVLGTGSDNLKRINFKIYLENTEKGNILNEDINEENMIPEVRFGAEFGGRNIQCAPVIDGIIQFPKSEKLINCEALVNLDQEFTEYKLDIGLKYKYEKVASFKNFELKAEQLAA